MITDDLRTRPVRQNSDEGVYAPIRQGNPWQEAFATRSRIGLVAPAILMALIVLLALSAVALVGALTRRLPGADILKQPMPTVHVAGAHAPPAVSSRWQTPSIEAILQFLSAQSLRLIEPLALARPSAQGIFTQPTLEPLEMTHQPIQAQPHPTPLRSGPLTGLVLGEKYRLGERLGQRSMGIVYKAHNQLLKRPQAIKVLLEHHSCDATFCERFLREAQTLAALDHANIVPIHDFGVEGQRAYLVMPFISGGTLDQMLQQHDAPLSLEHTFPLLRQLAAALDYAHTLGIIHLDLKPANILLHPDGRLVLADFGVAHLTRAGARKVGGNLHFGTPSYMAPEHIRGHPELASDLYALGVLLYQMLCGRLPFQGSSPLTIFRKHMMELPLSLRIIRPDLPQAIDDVLAIALAKHPQERYQSASALLRAFEEAVKTASDARSEKVLVC